MQVFLKNLSENELKAIEKLAKNNNSVDHKADKRNSTVLLEGDVYINHTENTRKYNTKFEKSDIKSRTLNFQLNHRKSINKT